MKLISMTDFVLEQDNRQNDFVDYKRKVLNYAKFLKRPLELWMFVPCDEDGKVIQEYECSLGKSCANPYCVKYNNRKERCLFEGFIKGAHFEIIYHNDTIEDLIGNKISLTKAAIEKL